MFNPSILQFFNSSIIRIGTAPLIATVATTAPEYISLDWHGR
jgi:hypothetical protein